MSRLSYKFKMKNLNLNFGPTLTRKRLIKYLCNKPDNEPFCRYNTDVTQHALLTLDKNLNV